MTTPRLGLAEWNIAQSRAHIPVNLTFRILDALLQSVVQNQTTNAPPTPVAGQAYIVGSTPTGAWTGKAGNIAFYYGEEWLFIAPQQGMLVYDLAQAKYYSYDGAAWVEFAGGGGGGVTWPLDIPEIAEPADPGANIARFYARDSNGITVLEYKTDNGNTIRLARDSLVIVRNTSGSPMTAGQVVYITGATGQIPNVSLYIADGSLIEPRPLGLIYNDVANNGFALCIQNGRIDRLVTTGFPEGDRVYASASVAGALTITPPSHPNLRVVIGVVMQEHATQGAILVQPISIRGDHIGTRSNTWSIGDGTQADVDIDFLNNAGLSTLLANPTAARTWTLPDASGTLALLSNIRKIAGAAWDGGGGVISDAPQIVVFFERAATIKSATVFGNAVGSCVIDVRKKARTALPASNGDSICAAAKPTVSGARTSRDTTLTGWTTSVAAGDTLTFVIQSVSVFTLLQIVLDCEETP